MSTTFKTILSGCLEFGNQRSYDQVLKLYQHRTENYYRNDILLKAEEVFREESFILTVPRFIKECPEKKLEKHPESARIRCRVCRRR